MPRFQRVRSPHATRHPAGDRRRGHDSGSASIELAILAPAVLAVVAMLFIAGRTVIAKQSVEAAAFDAARTASLARSAGTAETRAEDAARNFLDDQNINCVQLTVAVNTAGFGVPVGQPANVTATVECVVNNSDVAFPGMPGTARLTATFTSPLDQYRGRQ